MTYQQDGATANARRKALAPSQLPSCQEYVVELERSTSSAALLGLGVNCGDGETFLVRSLKHGMVQTYNKSVDAEKQIKEGDRIIEINGVRANIKRMLEPVLSSKKLTLVVQRTKMTTAIGANIFEASQSVANQESKNVVKSAAGSRRSVHICETQEEVRYKALSDLGISEEQVQNFDCVALKLRTMTVSSETDMLRSDSDFGLSDQQLHDFNWMAGKVRAMTFSDDVLCDESDFGLSDQQLENLNWTSNKLRALTAHEDDQMCHSDSDYGLSENQLQNFNWVVNKLRTMTDISDSGNRNSVRDSVFGLSDEQFQSLMEKISSRPQSFMFESQ